MNSHLWCSLLVFFSCGFSLLDSESWILLAIANCNFTVAWMAHFVWLQNALPHPHSPLYECSGPAPIVTEGTLGSTFRSLMRSSFLAIVIALVRCVQMPSWRLGALAAAFAAVLGARTGVEASKEALYDFATTHVETIFYPAVQYGKVWGQSFKGNSYKDWTVEDKTAALINRMCLQNAASAAVVSASMQTATVASMGLGLPASIAGQISASLAASMFLQIALVSAVATARGFDVDDSRTIWMIMMVLAGDISTESIKAIIAQTGAQGFAAFLKSGIGAYVQGINKVMWPILGRRFVTIAGSTGVINLSSWIPVVGPALSFVTDGSMCKFIARTFDWYIFSHAYMDQVRIP